MSVDLTADALRREFDRSFAEAPRVATAGTTRMIELRVGGDRYAVRLDEVDSLHVGRRIMPVPGPLPELLGLAAFRGELVSVWDLAAILGYPATRHPRWILVARKARTGLAVESYERYLAVLADSVGARDAATGRPHLEGVVRDGQGLLPLIDLPAVLAELARRAQTTLAHKER